MIDFEDAYPLVNAQALIEAWKTYEERLSWIIKTEHSTDGTLSDWADNIASFLVILKLLRRRNAGNKGPRGTFENAIEKLLVFRSVCMII